MPPAMMLRLLVIRRQFDVATLVTADRRRLLGSPKTGAAAFRLFERLPMMPRFTVEKARQQMATSFPTANAAVELLTAPGIAEEMTGQGRTGPSAISITSNCLPEPS